jgi:hypothetical protein
VLHDGEGFNNAVAALLWLYRSSIVSPSFKEFCELILPFSSNEILLGSDGSQAETGDEQTGWCKSRWLSFTSCVTYGGQTVPQRFIINYDVVVVARYGRYVR